MKSALQQVLRDLPIAAHAVRSAVEAKRKVEESVEHRIFNNLRRAYEKPATQAGDAWLSNAKRVFWEILQPANGTAVEWSDVERHFQQLSRQTGQKYEVARIRLLWDYHPSSVYVGLHEFDGYVVFVFPSSDRAFVECPLVGNALYVMKAEEWRFFSTLGKRQLLEEYPDRVHRIVHNGNGWKNRVKRMLENARPRNLRN